MLYARAITLRNCGRFSVVASDFGSDYRTHTHVTSEALYASLTRGATWKPDPIDLKDDRYEFAQTYDVAAMPIWFLPGIFMAHASHRLSDAYLDTTAFNVVHEFYPSTSHSYVHKGADLRQKDRPYYAPTYGTIQALKPDNRVVTYAFSPEQGLIERFAQDQTFIMGKKRTMFQIVDLSAIVEGVRKKGVCAVWWLELPPNGGVKFRSFEICVATMRYIILRGVTKDTVKYFEFSFRDKTISLPDFYLDWVPFEVRF